MNGAHLHLLLNHFPIIVMIVGFLIMVGGFIFKSEILKRASYCIFILSAITAIPTFLSGGEAEEVVEGINGIDEQFIKVHEETAEVFATLLYVLGGISLIGLWANWKKKSYSNIISFVIIAFSLIVLFYGKKTGTTGGEIRHTEIRADYSTVSTSVIENDKDH